MPLLRWLMSPSNVIRIGARIVVYRYYNTDWVNLHLQLDLELKKLNPFLGSQSFRYFSSFSLAFLHAAFCVPHRLSALL